MLKRVKDWTIGKIKKLKLKDIETSWWRTVHHQGIVFICQFPMLREIVNEWKLFFFNKTRKQINCFESSLKVYKRGLLFLKERDVSWLNMRTDNQRQIQADTSRKTKSQKYRVSTYLNHSQRDIADICV